MGPQFLSGLRAHVNVEPCALFYVVDNCFYSKFYGCTCIWLSVNIVFPDHTISLLQVQLFSFSLTFLFSDESIDFDDFDSEG